MISYENMSEDWLITFTFSLPVCTMPAFTGDGVAMLAQYMNMRCRLAI